MLLLVYSWIGSTTNLPYCANYKLQYRRHLAMLRKWGVKRFCVGTTRLLPHRVMQSGLTKKHYQKASRSIYVKSTLALYNCVSNVEMSRLVYWVSLFLGFTARHDIWGKTAVSIQHPPHNCHLERSAIASSHKCDAPSAKSKDR